MGAGSALWDCGGDSLRLTAAGSAVCQAWGQDMRQGADSSGERTLVDGVQQHVQAGSIGRRRPVHRPLPALLAVLARGGAVPVGARCRAGPCVSTLPRLTHRRKMADKMWAWYLSPR